MNAENQFSVVFSYENRKYYRLHRTRKIMICIFPYLWDPHDLWPRIEMCNLIIWFGKNRHVQWRRAALGWFEFHEAASFCIVWRRWGRVLGYLRAFISLVRERRSRLGWPVWLPVEMRRISIPTRFRIRGILEFPSSIIHLVSMLHLVRAKLPKENENHHDVPHITVLVVFVCINLKSFVSKLWQCPQVNMLYWDKYYTKHMHLRIYF